MLIFLTLVTARTLLGQRPDLDLTIRDHLGQTPLGYACASRRENQKMIKLLLQHGAQADEIDEHGVSFLWHILLGPTYRVSTVKALLDGGARPDHMSVERLAPIHVAIFSAHPA
jgi:ankyrin repeat protein